MTNHVHRLMTAAQDHGVAAVMKRVGQRYVQYVNRTYQRTGGLFEGRFRSSLIEAEVYLLACQRYIELNPVRASMVRAPGEYPWSSYRANALSGTHGPVTAHPVYRELADSEQARRVAYGRLFQDALSPGLLERLRDCTNGGFVLGSQTFARQIAAMVGRRTWKGSPGRPRKETDASRQGRLPL
jgi:putative transposase